MKVLEDCYMTQKPDWWEWINKDVPIGTPWELFEDAPDDVKAKFEEWKQRDKRNKKEGLYA